MGIAIFKLSGEKMTSCKEILVGLWSYPGHSGGLKPIMSSEAQGAGDTSASFTLDVFLSAFCSQS